MHTCRPQPIWPQSIWPPFTIYGHVHQYCGHLVAQALHEFKNSTILVCVILNGYYGPTGCGLQQVNPIQLVIFT